MSQVVLTPQTAPLPPALGKFIIYVDSSDNRAKKMDSAWTIVDLEQNQDDFWIWRWEAASVDANTYDVTIPWWWTPNTLLNTLVVKIPSDNVLTPLATPVIRVNFWPWIPVVRYDWNNLTAGFLKANMIYILTLDATLNRFRILNDNDNSVWEANTAVNMWAGTWYIFKQKTGAIIELRTLVGKGWIFATNDVPNDTVVVTNHAYEWAQINVTAWNAYLDTHGLWVTQADVQDWRYQVFFNYRNASNNWVSAPSLNVWLQLVQNVWNAGSPASSDQIYRQANTIRYYAGLSASNVSVFIVKNR